MEDNMKTTTLPEKTRIDMGYEASWFALHLTIGLAVLIGLWGLACLIGGLATHGVDGLIKGFLIAVTGG